MNEIFTEQTDFLNDDHQKIHQCAAETNQNDGLLAQIATVVQVSFIPCICTGV